MPTPPRLTPAPTAVADIAAARTAAAIENLTIATYARMAQLASIRGLAGPTGTTLSAFLTVTVQQHTDHLTAFNAVAIRLGATAQHAADRPLATGVVLPALEAVTTALDVVTFAASLELIAAATYTAQTAAVADRQLRNSFASIAGVEAQHRAVLLTIAALLAADPTSPITLPLDPTHLAATVASAATPSAFLRTDDARPATEGAAR